ncbi:hypothetical protein [Campylobacter sp. RM16190]|uniref:hypothetical protein n=1 Tax=Campylobacter sp. RM16190 TaxID=1705727 RepID=UPI001474FA52|nr:hypothetical protein [Campylobacter sp. RM16190]
MKRIFLILFLLFKISVADEINFDIFYDQNISNEEVDKELDKLLIVLNKNQSLINKEFGDGERIFSFFIINSKVGNTGKFDFGRIEKVLKFKPDLNYDMYQIKNTSPLHMAMALGFNNETKNRISEYEILNLIKILVKNGADVKAKELLVTAYNINRFKIFKYFLDSGTKDATKIMFSIAADMGIFMGNNGLSINKNKLENSKEREFITTDKFKNFYESKIRFLKEALKFVKLNEFDLKDIEIFIIVNSILDNDKAIQILLDNELCKLANICDFLKETARHYNSKKILKLLK